MRIRRIATKEFVEMTRDGRFRWSCAILSTLTVLALAVGIKTYRDVDRLHREAQAEAREHWDHQGEKNPHAAAHYGLYLFEPKSSLSFFDRGVESYTGVTVFLEAHKQNDMKNRPARDGTSLQRFGEMTAAMVLQTLVPLVIVFLSFPMIAGEREQGTLRLLMSQGVRPFEIAAGKALGTVSALGVIILPAALFGAVSLWLPSNTTEVVNPGHIMALALCYLFYFMTFLAISMSVSAVGRSSSSVLVWLLGFWIFNVLMAPRISAEIANWAIPLPSAFEFEKAIEQDIAQGIDGHDPASERLEKLKRELLAKHQVETVEDLPVNFAGVVLKESEDYGNRVFDKHFGELWAKIERQDVLAQLISFVSPTMAVRSLSMAICRSDTADHLEFTRQAEAYRRELIGRLNQDLIENGADSGFNYAADDEMWKSMPLFRYRPESLADVLKNQVIAVISLSSWLVAALVCAIGMTSRIRVD